MKMTTLKKKWKQNAVRLSSVNLVSIFHLISAIDRKKKKTLQKCVCLTFSSFYVKYKVACLYIQSLKTVGGNLEEPLKCPELVEPKWRIVAEH